MWSDTIEKVVERQERGQSPVAVLASNGGILWKFINEEFGDITGTNSVENPKTSNPIQVWVWTIPHEAFREWYIKERVERAKKL